MFLSQALDINFEPIDFTYTVPVSISLQSVTTAICPMEKAEFPKLEFPGTDLELKHTSVVEVSDLESESECCSNIRGADVPDGK